MFSYDENGVTKRYGIHRSCGQSGHLKKNSDKSDTLKRAAYLKQIWKNANYH